VIVHALAAAAARQSVPRVSVARMMRAFLAARATAPTLLQERAFGRPPTGSCGWFAAVKCGTERAPWIDKVRCTRL
jgi:hypothetical protein